jgi:hypothetical protein
MAADPSRGREPASPAQIVLLALGTFATSTGLARQLTDSWERGIRVGVGVTLLLVAFAVRRRRRRDAAS